MMRSAAADRVTRNASAVRLAADAGGPTFSYIAYVGGCSKYTTIPNEPITVFVDPYCYRGSGAVMVVGANSNDVTVAHALKKPVDAPTDGGLVAVTTEEWSTRRSRVAKRPTRCQLGRPS